MELHAHVSQPAHNQELPRARHQNQSVAANHCSAKVILQGVALTGSRRRRRFAAARRPVWYLRASGGPTGAGSATSSSAARLPSVARSTRSCPTCLKPANRPCSAACWANRLRGTWRASRCSLRFWASPAASERAADPRGLAPRRVQGDRLNAARLPRRGQSRPASPVLYPHVRHAHACLLPCHCGIAAAGAHHAHHH